MHLKIEEGLEKLNGLLPVLERKNILPKICCDSSTDILKRFADSVCVHNDYDERCLDLLASQDLIVFGKENKKIYAMCVFDGIATAPVFNIKTKIVSRCFLTGKEIVIKQNGQTLEKVLPSEDVFIGVRWQPAGACATENLRLQNKS